ncbi:MULTISPECIES: hypothetical protein [unclassified Pseudoalteromonas]|uniref:hypothetical protein n=1 Tax=unclassified Pseudoalteromonas TaxID=194690 RepID=UPI0013FD4EC5|nr:MULTISPECIES: hypothetical protein [unclassified Pseudoalteromonas]MBG9991107.1 hypothetical protein [Pseudoalteromonas sp. NZS37]
MRELNVKEINEVNGGVRGFILSYIAGKVLDAAISADWSQASHNSSNPMAATNRL